jgi:signal transduction histidine kinase
VSRRGRISRLLFRLRHPQTTVRWRLTLLYGSLFLVSGAALLAITYTFVAHQTPTMGPVRGILFSRGAPRPNFVTPPDGPPRFTGLPPKIKRALISRAGRAAVQVVVSNQRGADLHQLEVKSGIALAIMAVISGLLGWVVAGRVLRPLRTITTTAQQISEASLHRRIAMRGPRDELRQLADTIDGLLERLQGAFDAQRRFVANASHELRTPLTVARALLEMVLSDPRANLETFRETSQQVLLENEHQEQLIDALLALAQGQRSLDHRQAIDLEALVREQVARREAEAGARGLDISLALAPGQAYGDRRLVERLVSNLLDNAIRHNQPSGWVRIALRPQDGRSALSVSNSGAPMSTEDASRILQPFQRLAPERTVQDEGLGLGLSIVAAVAAAHGAQLELTPHPGGGLQVEVRFPAPPASERAPAPVPPGADAGELFPVPG